VLRIDIHSVVPNWPNHSWWVGNDPLLIMLELMMMAKHCGGFAYTSRSLSPSLSVLQLLYCLLPHIEHRRNRKASVWNS